MILHQVHSIDVARLPFESKTPGAIDVDRIALRQAPEPMEIETWLIQLSERLCKFESVQSHSYPLLQCRRDLGGDPALVEFLETLVPKALDSSGSVRRYLTPVKEQERGTVSD
jgi:hypothetical protein